MTIEQKVAQAILEEPVSELEIEGRKYPIAPPSLGTLVKVSEIVSTFPEVQDVPAEEVVTEVLRTARGFSALGDLAAVLILGVRNLTEEQEVEEDVVESRFWGLVKRTRKVKRKVVVDRKAELAKLIMENVGPKTMLDVIVRRLRDMEIGDFFGITTSLSAVNLLTPPKKEVD